MWKRKALLGAIALSSIGFMPIPASAQVYIEVAPPPPRHEVIPAHRPGYVWQEGYWDWRGKRHVWVRGHWVRERPGYYWHPSRWEHRDGRWYLVKGRWDRQRYARWDDRRGPGGDRDRDGIPNRLDRDRDGDGIRNDRDPQPNVPNARPRDRDGDGVPNRFDERPNNPWRQ
jgi:hypothetical protein